jgi:hypothetical protein
MTFRVPAGRLVLIGAALAALTAGGAAVHEPGQLGIGSDTRRIAFVAITLAAGACYLLAVRLVRRGTLPRHAVWTVLAVAALLRLIVLPGPAFLSNDVNRYVWDGRVQRAGINPYRYMPADPALAPLRDATVYPFINRADTAHTIYPPVAQMVFLATAWVSPGVPAMKLAMVGAELIGIGALLALLRHAGLPLAQVLIYAWHPLPVWEFAGNGHVDALVIAFVALALLASARGRAAATGAALAAAALVKFLPAVLLPALWRRRDWRLPAAFAATAAACYLPYLGAGSHVLGFLPGYAGEEGLTSGRGLYWLSLIDHFIPLPAWAGKLYLAAVLATLVVVGASMMGRPPAPGREQAVIGPARDALLLATLLMVTLTPHYAWYFAWLLVPACLVPAPPVLFLTVASISIYQDPFGAKLLWPGVMYGPFLVLLLTRMGRRASGGAVPTTRSR